MFFMTKDLVQKRRWHLVVMTLQSPLVRNNSLVLTLTFLTLIVLKIKTSYFVECLSVWVCLMFTHEAMHLWQEYYINGAVFFSLQPLWWHLILICLIIDDTAFDHLIRVVSVRLIYCKVTYVGSILWRMDFETM